MTTTATDPNDPGPEIANERADDVESAAMVPIEIPAGGRIRIGTASWTDPTMTAAGVFYPASATTAEERLQYYASTFPLVEVDATYYALPPTRTAELWVDRTPPDFTFDIKAHALMTGQGTETKRLPKAIREELPGRAAGEDADLRQGPAGRAAGRGLGDVPRRPGAAPRGAASSARSCSSTRAGSSRPRRTGRRSRTPSSGSTGWTPRRRVPQRLVAQREERRADAALPGRPQRSRSSWSTSRRASRAACRRSRR